MLGFCFSIKDAKLFIDPTIDGAASMHIPRHELHNKASFSRYAANILKISRPFVVLGSFNSTEID